MSMRLFVNLSFETSRGMRRRKGKSTISPLLFPIPFAVRNLIGQFVGTLSMHSSPSSLASNSVICQIWTFIKWICESLVITECSPEKIRSLSKDVLERRTSSGNGPFPFLGSGFAQILGKIFSTRIKTLSNTNLLASRHIIREKNSLPVEVLRPKMPLLKLPHNLNKRFKI